MKRDVELYIAGHKVDLADGQVIAFTHQTTDYTDPTAIKNTYSNTISLEGTKNNNALFKSIYNLERTQVQNSGYFNPSKREEFQLLVNGELIESGYAKLDEVTNNGNHTTYTVTLFGGLGSFFYSLAYDNEGNERKLDSLNWIDGTDSELDLIINKDTVWDAWDSLIGGGNDECNNCGYVGHFGTRCPNCQSTNVTHHESSAKYDIINFAPAYNGYAQDFDSNKVLVDAQNYQGKVRVGNSTNPDNVAFPTTIGEGYETYNGYVLGELRENMNEWETRDLRSYLQRPVLRVKKFIEAICNPENNGGYTVNLDNEFFNNSNPYYEKAWMTLPMLSTIGGENQPTPWTWTANSIETYNVAKTDYKVQTTSISAIAPETYEIKFKLRATDMSATSTNLYTSAKLNDVLHGGGMTVQFYGMDSSNNVVAYSNVLWLTSKLSDGSFLSFDNSVYSTVYMGQPSVKNMFGSWVRAGSGIYEWDNDITLRLDSNASAIQSLKVMIVWNAELVHTTDYHGNPAITWGDARMCGFTSQYYYSQSAYSSGKVSFYNKRVVSPLTSRVFFKSTTENAKVDGAFTNMMINKKLIFGSLDGNILSWLLSYTKLFGMYFVKDKYEKKISILTRKNYYYSTNVIDIDNQINHIDDINITPLTFDKKWYKMGFPTQETSNFLDKYKSKYNTDLGSQRINTGYNFDEETKDIYEDSLFANAVECSEMSKYFKHRVLDGGDIPPCLYEWTNFTYHKNDDTQSIYIGMPKGYGENALLSGFENYDLFPKMQLHNSDAPNNGAGVLCFFDGYANLADAEGNRVHYYLTDDIFQMFTLNSNPCWLYAPEVSNDVSRIPMFSRYATSNDLINNTWDFGRSKELFVPNFKYGSYVIPTLYENYWQSYMNDLLDVDTRKVDCTVLFKGKIDDECLRRFYFFNNGYWVMTKIDQYDPRSFEGTRCSFTKVMDINNYRGVVNYKATIKLELEHTIVTKEAQSVRGWVYVSDGSRWSTSDAKISPSSGYGERTQIYIELPANSTTSNKTWYIEVHTDEGATARVELIQLGERSITISSTSPYWTTDGVGGGWLDAPAEGGTYRLNITFSGRMPNEQINPDSNEGDDFDYVSWGTINWASSTSSSGWMEVNFLINRGNERRTGQYISFKDIEGVDRSVSVGFRQDAAVSSVLDVKPTTLEMDYEANSNGTLTITTGNAWTATIG